MNLPETLNSNDGQVASLNGSNHTFDPRLGAPQQATNDEIDLLKIIVALWRKKFLIIAISLIGAVIGFFISIRMTPIYAAEARLEVEKQETEIIEGGLNAPSIADSEFIATKLQVLKGRALAERVAEKLGITRNADLVDQSLPLERRTRIVGGMLLSNLQAEAVGRSRIIKLRFEGPDPRLAASIVNTWSDAFIESTLERKFNDTKYGREFLTERLAQAKITLEEAEKAVVSYAKENDLFELQTGEQTTSLTNNRILRLDEEQAAAREALDEAQQNYAALAAGSISADLLDNAELNQLESERLKLERRYQDQLTIYKPGFPEMLQLKAEIDETTKQFNAQREKIISGILDDAAAEEKAARERLAEISGRLSSLTAEAEDIRDRRIQYTILQREVDTARSQYDALLQRLKEVGISAGVGSSQISVVDPAIVPSRPFSPNIQINTAIGLIAALALACGCIVALDFLNDTIQTPEDIKTKLKIPAMGVVPKISGGTKQDMVLEALRTPRSSVAEAYFSARTAIEFSTGKGRPKSIVLSSSQPGEGKTSSAIAFGMVFAGKNLSVLIIDADMRKPSFVADAELSIGLSGLLTDRDADLRANLIKSNLEENLYLLPSGVIPPNPAELLTGDQLQAIVREAETMFDVVIVDAPPVLTFADAPVLASACEATLVAIKSGKIRTKAAKQTVERLRANGGNVVGAILNQFDAKKVGYDYNYYYYAYGDAGEKYGEKALSNSKKGSTRKTHLFDQDAI